MAFARCLVTPRSDGGSSLLSENDLLKIRDNFSGVKNFESGAAKFTVWGAFPKVLMLKKALGNIYRRLRLVIAASLKSLKKRPVLSYKWP